MNSIQTNQVISISEIYKDSEIATELSMTPIKQ